MLIVKQMSPRTLNPLLLIMLLLTNLMLVNIGHQNKRNRLLVVSVFVRTVKDKAWARYQGQVEINST